MRQLKPKNRLSEDGFQELIAPFSGLELEEFRKRALAVSLGSKMNLGKSMRYRCLVNVLCGIMANDS